MVGKFRFHCICWGLILVYLRLDNEMKKDVVQDLKRLMAFNCDLMEFH